MTTRKLSSGKYIYTHRYIMTAVYYTYTYIYNMRVGMNRLGKMGVSTNCSIRWIIALVNYLESTDRKNLRYSGNLSYRRKLSTDRRYVYRNTKYILCYKIVLSNNFERSTNFQFAVYALFCFTAILVKKIRNSVISNTLSHKHIIY